MSITTIVTVGLIAVSTIFSVITTIRSGKSRKSTKDVGVENETGHATDTEVNSKGSKSFMEHFSSTLETLIGNISSAETLYNAISTGKTGNLKLTDVLNKIKIDCLTKGEEFDENSWTNIINKLIDFSKNINK